jgi:hypothetical protein
MPEFPVERIVLPRMELLAQPLRRRIPNGGILNPNARVPGGEDRVAQNGIIGTAIEKANPYITAIREGIPRYRIILGGIIEDDPVISMGDGIPCHAPMGDIHQGQGGHGLG